MSENKVSRFIYLVKFNNEDGYQEEGDEQE